MSMIERVTRWIWAFALHVMRRATPFFVCLFGMSAPVVFSPNNIWIGLLIAGGSFAWALDMTAARAAAEAKEQAVQALAKILVGGTDSTVTVDINHKVNDE